MKRYTEGICCDGAAILDNGAQITISEILFRLNELDKIDNLKTFNKRKLLIKFSRFIQKYKNKGLDFDCVEREVDTFLNI